MLVLRYSISEFTIQKLNFSLKRRAEIHRHLSTTTTNPEMRQEN